MGIMSEDKTEYSIGRQTYWQDARIAEFSLLLPAREIAQIERLAHSQNVTLGQLVRRLIRDYLTNQLTIDLVSNRPMGSLTIPWGHRFRSSRH
jgi:hypothetical protein